MANGFDIASRVERSIENAVKRLRLRADQIDNQILARNLSPTGNTGSGYTPAIEVDETILTIGGGAIKTISFLSQAANKVLSGPVTGADATPTFRSLVVADLPVGSAQHQFLVTGATPFAPSYVSLTTLAGDGLSHSAGALNINVGASLTLVADTLQVKSSSTANQTLLSAGSPGTDPTWGALPLGSSNAVTGLLGSSNGGTGVNNGGATLTFGSSVAITGGGTLALGGFTLTVPATGTAALLAVANVFTNTQEVDVATATNNALILKSTDSSATNPLLKVMDGASTNLIIDKSGRLGIQIAAFTGSSTLEMYGTLTQRAPATVTHIQRYEITVPASGTEMANWTIHSDGSNARAKISAVTDGAGRADTLHPTALIFYRGGNAAAISEGMRLTSSGDLGIGTGSTVSARLHVLGAVAATPLLLLKGAASQSGNYLTIQTNGSVDLVTVSSVGTATVKALDAATNTITSALVLGHNSSGTPAAGFGSAIALNLHSSTTTDQSAARLRWYWDTATHASRAGHGVLSAYYTSTERDVIGWAADSSAALLGFYNISTAPIAQPANTVALDTLLVNLGLRASGGVALFDTDIKVGVVGKGIYIKEGANGTSGVATLVGGTVVVNTTKVTANSRIYLTVQELGTVVTPMAIGVTARVAGTSFTITSADATDTSDVAWVIVEPA